MRKMRLSGGTLGLASVFVLGACGAGTAGIIAGADGGGGSDAPSVTIALGNQATSPATIKLKSNRRAVIDVRRNTSSGSSKLGELTPANPITLEANVEKELSWSFATDLNASGLLKGVTVFAAFKDSEESLDEDEGDLGNEQPVLEIVNAPPPDVDVDGVVPVRLMLSDSTFSDGSGDVVDIAVDFQLAGEDDWHSARPGGLAASDATPVPALPGQEAPETPRLLTFFWDTDSDLRDLERNVRLRFTPDDGTPNPSGVGEEKLTPFFTVDNNEEPLVQLDSGPVVANSDERRGIPVPFRVIDEEADSVEVVFQWRRQSEDFPALGTDRILTNAEIERILKNPAERARLHICTPYPYLASGLVIPRSEVSVRLPELAREMNWIIPSGIVDRTLELLRPSSIPAPIAETWDENPLEGPVAAVPIGDGTTALVLQDGGKSWSLHAIELATGRSSIELDQLPTTGPGRPTAMCLERGGDAVLVASDLSGAWRIVRVDLKKGSVRELFLSDGVPPEIVRGIASLGRNAALFTAGSSLFHLDYRDSGSKVGAVLSGLAAPWGVTLDLSEPARAYVSEREANRLLSVDLDAHAELPVVVRTETLSQLDFPEALAFERGTARLLIVTGEPVRKQLFGLDLGALGGNTSFVIGPPIEDDVTSVASGADGLRLLAVPARDELLVASGVEQSRKITAHDRSRQEVTVDAVFDPDVQPGSIWRIPAQRDPGTRGLIASPPPDGTGDFFVWDSGVDVPDGGPTFLRALARDDEVGLLVAGTAPKTVRSSLDVDPVQLGRVDGGEVWTTSPRMTALGDLDGDGDLDIVSANQGRRPGPGLPTVGDNLTIFRQDPPGVFPVKPSFMLGGGATTPSVQYIALGDLNDDGRLDLVSANRNRVRNALNEPLGGGDVTVFFQDPSGTFPTEPSLVLGGLGFPRKLRKRSVSDGGTEQEREGPGLTPITQGPTSVAIGDLNSDGRLDIASANEGEQPVGHPRRYDDLTVFLQDPTGGFPTQPSLRLGNSLSTPRPQSVAIGDLDGDGDSDLVSANEDGDNLTIFRQDRGVLPLTPTMTLGNATITPGPEFVAIGDIDGDGAQDLVSVDEDSDDLRIFYQDQGAVWGFTADDQPLGGSPFTVGPESVALGDVDGDGDVDLVTTNEDGSNLAVFYQVVPRTSPTQPPRFSPASTIGGPGRTDDPHGVSLDDLDGDGDLDLVAANDEGDDLKVFWQKTTGSFTPPFPVGGFPTTNQPVCVALGDLDGDGDKDLVAGNRDGDNLTIFVQDPPGSFVLGTTLRELTNFPHSVAVGDLDGDGSLDLVSANKDGNNLAVFFQDDQEPAGFTAAVPLGGTSTTPTPRSVAVGDLDGDGKEDVVSANEGNEALTVFLQGKDRGFSPAPSVGPTGIAPYFVAIGDIDLDGELDLVSANRGGSTLSVFLREAGAFSPLQPLGDATVTSLARSVAIGDLDQDGDPDLVCANEGGHSLTLFFQDSPASFVPSGTIGNSQITNAPFSVAVSDLDGDGDQDIVSANSGSHAMTIFLQSRLGSFASSPKVLGGVSTTPAPWSVALGDLDGDGDPDVVSANRGTPGAGDFRDGKLTVFWGGR